ncbi:hypothetical protein GCM10007989_29860 [Devosia pacifica]|uniref:Uncharacterized protein n=1 Tax=Devosia pacifica TaxID=1335967 RepID=A0A918SBX9_9HYPH|nr:hypothetical protein [Devosia pacifica]GHA31820.1 hypothetical protein GCM10007989_29860 [Devosia pacifica]
MSNPTQHRGSILPQDTDFDSGADQPGIAQPISQTEIEDLMYTDARPVEDRLARLREMREEAAARVHADLGEQDARDLTDEIDAAIETLSRDEQFADDNDDLAGLDPAYEADPADHLDTLSPDDDEARDAIEGDEASEEEREASYEEDLESLDDAVLNEHHRKS